MNLKSMVAGACALVAGVACAAADYTPVMVSLVTPVQVPSRDYDVGGFRLSLIYGDCQGFKGLDIGLAQRAAGDFTGIALGGINIAGGRFLGGQVGAVNWCYDATTSWTRRSIGGQIGLLNRAGAFCGLQYGVANVATVSFAGLQDGLFNYSYDLHGLQCGLYLIGAINVASGSVRGCQIGLINVAETMECGLQVGLLNIISNKGWLPVLPLVNGHF